MQRDVAALQSKTFDVLVVGAGVHGACVARDAALRGLSVAMIDKGDICGATSHNSLKTIHGGIRYLQHLNFKRSLESIKEQKYWLATAPHLVKPLPFLMPTYGYGMRGPLAMYIGIRLFELLGIGRNRKLSDQSKLARGKIVSKQQCLQLAPNIKQENLTGGALWDDAQVHYADAAVLQVSQNAVDHGACVANYIEATQFLLESRQGEGSTKNSEKNKVVGVVVTDCLTQTSFNIKARNVVNAAGPWMADLMQSSSDNYSASYSASSSGTKTHVGPNQDLSIALTKSMNIVTRQVPPSMAVAVQSKRQSDSRVGTTKRLYFIVPWKGCSMIGTTHFPYQGRLSDLRIEEDDVMQFIDEINHAHPSLNLTKQDVLYCYQGVTPAGEDEQVESSGNPNRLHHSRVIDHAKQDQLEGLISLVSVKWTTARLVAEKAVDVLAKKLSCHNPCLTRTSPIENSVLIKDGWSDMSDKELEQVCSEHLQHSMAINLDDMLLRRSNDLATGQLDFDCLLKVAHIMAQYHSWDKTQLQAQGQRLLRSWLPEELRQQLLNTPL